MKKNDELNSHERLPGILITGASGFIGRHFVASLKEDYRLYCIARRSRDESGIPEHRNIYWTQADIANMHNVNDIVQSIGKYGEVDYVVHLAGYYDFTYEDNPEYERTNVAGTRNILELSKQLKVRRFIFSSSLAACSFSNGFGKVIDENSHVDADFAYARSKKAGEKLMKEYSDFFPCTVVRLAAVFSDWCEYPPLYEFLKTWLSRAWNSKIIGGKGESSITYIHINDLISLFKKIFEKSEKLPVYSIYIASSSGTVSHNNLFRSSTKYYFGESLKSLNIPKYIAIPGVVAKQFFFRLLGKESFERLWMMKYLDKKLVVENAFTCKTLSWNVTPRYDIIRRLLFMIEKMKNNQIEWNYRNEAARIKTIYRPNIMVYNALIRSREFIVDKMLNYIYQEDNQHVFPGYRQFDRESLKWLTTMIFMLIVVSIRNKDRRLMSNYVRIMTYRRYLEGFDAAEMSDFYQVMIRMINNSLQSVLNKNKYKNYKEITHYLNVVLQLTVDEMEDYYDLLKLEIRNLRYKQPVYCADVEELKYLVFMLEDTFSDPLQFIFNITYSKLTN